MTFSPWVLSCMITGNKALIIDDAESRAKELELAWQSNVDEIQRMNKQVDSVFDNITSGTL